MTARKMELTAGEYGCHLFQMMLCAPQGLAHWDSIRAEAEPLVRQLLALNDKMGVYTITGVPVRRRDGKPKITLSKRARIRAAMESKWGCKAGKCKKGDHVWLIHHRDHPCEEVVSGSDCVVEMVRAKTIVVADRVWGEWVLKEVRRGEIVLRAPRELIAAWNNLKRASATEYQTALSERDAIEMRLFSDDYWLAVADEMDI